MSSKPHELLMPQLGQTMTAGIVKWEVPDQATVQAHSIVMTIESEKTAFDIEAPVGGVLHRLVESGAEAKVGTVLGVIADADYVPGAKVGPLTLNSPERLSTQESSQTPRQAGSRGSRILASPKARVVAGQSGVDLRHVSASRRDGLITAEDVLRQVQTRAPSFDRPIRSRDRLTAFRRNANSRLAKSWREAPHFVQMIDVDATALVAARERIRAQSLGFSLNDVFVKVAAQTLASFEDLNAMIQDDELVGFENVDVALAVRTERGLLAPVLRAAQALSLEQIGQQMRQLIEAARLGRLPPRNTGPASLTLSNLGRYGVRCGTPVLNLDEPVLVFIGSIEERPVGKEGRIELRPMTTLSIAFDHRIVDGLRAAEFSQALRERLETLSDTNSAAAQPGPCDASAPR